MVLLHIIPRSDKQADEIIPLLLNNKLIMNAVVMEKVIVHHQSGKGSIDKTTRQLILCKTKALLFKPIDELLQSKYTGDMPVLYSLPIVHMDWKQADNLMRHTARV